MHIPVLLKEVVELLDIQDGDTYLDATLGEGGHTEAISKLDKKIEIAGIDADPMAVELSKERVPNGKFAVLNFKEIDKAPEIVGLDRPNKILFDLGWSKRQFEEEGKGFSFQKDEPLDMRLGSEGALTAKTIINTWEEENLRTIIEAYGEERFAGRIAKAIVKGRKIKPIKTTLELVEIIKKATPEFYHKRKIHAATRTFQALRITVNDELGALKEGIEKAFNILEIEGRMAIISFHSLEDRIVKNYFKSRNPLTKKPIMASPEEIKQNPRARSARLRVLKKL